MAGLLVNGGVPQKSKEPMLLKHRLSRGAVLCPQGGEETSEKGRQKGFCFQCKQSLRSQILGKMTRYSPEGRMDWREEKAGARMGRAPGEGSGGVALGAAEPDPEDGQAQQQVEGAERRPDQPQLDGGGFQIEPEHADAGGTAQGQQQEQKKGASQAV